MPRPSVRVTGLVLGLATALAGVLGCGSDTAAPAPLAANQIYAVLQLNQHALIMATTAPYDTVQLTATPLNGDGAPLTDVGPVTFTSKDSSVTVSPTGLVTAHYITPDGVLVPVVASLQDTVHNLTHVDTAFVVVTATAVPTGLTTFSLQPASGDSAKRALADGYGGGGLVVSDTVSWPATAVAAAHDTLCGIISGTASCSIPVYYHSANSRIALIDARTGVVTKRDTGHVWLAAQTLYYGRPYRDSVNFRVGLQIDAVVLLRSKVAGGTQIGSRIVLGVGGILAFLNFGRPVYGPVQITFSDPAAADTASVLGFTDGLSGNVAFNCDSLTNQYCFFPNEFAKARRFSRPGTVQMTVSSFPGFPGQTIEIDIVRE